MAGRIRAGESPESRVVIVSPSLQGFQGGPRYRWHTPPRARLSGPLSVPSIQVPKAPCSQPHTDAGSSPSHPSAGCPHGLVIHGFYPRPAATCGTLLSLMPSPTMDSTRPELLDVTSSAVPPRDDGDLPLHPVAAHSAAPAAFPANPQGLVSLPHPAARRVSPRISAASATSRERLGLEEALGAFLGAQRPSHSLRGPTYAREASKGIGPGQAGQSQPGAQRRDRSRDVTPWVWAASTREQARIGYIASRVGTTRRAVGGVREAGLRGPARCGRNWDHPSAISRPGEQFRTGQVSSRDHVRFGSARQARGGVVDLPAEWRRDPH